jgi:DNA-binding transcriptional MerR regulator
MEFNITAVAEEFGVTARTLRFYEQRGLLAPKRKGRCRVYDGECRSRLASILRAKQLGYSLSEIADMLRPSETGPCNLQLTLTQLENQIGYLHDEKRRLEIALTELNHIRQTMLGSTKPLD